MIKHRLPLQRCKWVRCRQSFQPRARKVKGRILLSAFCSWSCSSSYVAAHNKGKPLRAALAAARVRRQEKRLALWRDRFGLLTQREVDLAAHAEAFGYDRGYHVGYYAGRRRKPLKMAS